ncbi:MAG: ERF family protein, partial [Hyphomicrobiaceae bacterium]|nr:ERF family protein [Hyphomicrobiaceae bacterium]
MSEDHPTYEAPNMTATEVLLRQVIAPLHRQMNSLEQSVTNAVAPAPPQLDELFAALAIAQGEIKAAIADKENTHFNFKYADLDACWEACRKPLSDNELAVIQLPEVGESGAVTMVTILGHSSGQSISSTYTMHPDKTTPQGIASCMTYLRR